MRMMVSMERAHKSVVGVCFGVGLRSPCDEGVIEQRRKQRLSKWPVSQSQRCVSLETHNRIARFPLHFRFSTLDQSEGKLRTARFLLYFRFHG
jgi:hypothetical protein